jgi:hypothetical protein
MADERTSVRTSVLTAAEWAEARRSPDAAATMLGRHAQDASVPGAADVADHLRAAIALANDLLPPGHPRKITWATVDALDTAVQVYYDAVGSTFGELGTHRQPWEAMVSAVAALASLLPPREGGGANGAG